MLQVMLNQRHLEAAKSLVLPQPNGRKLMFPFSYRLRVDFFLLLFLFNKRKGGIHQL